MRTEIKLVQNTHWSLQCWYRTSLVFRRKTNANTNQTGIKYTLLLTMLVYRTSLVFRRKTNANKNQTGKNTHRSLQCQHRTSLVFRRKTNAYRNQTGGKDTPLLTVLVQNQSGIQKKNNANRTTLVFRRKQMRTGIKLVQKYTLVTIICCYRTSLVL